MHFLCSVMQSVICHLPAVTPFSKLSIYCHACALLKLHPVAQDL